MEKLRLTGQKGKEDRRELDFYPTPKNVTQALINYLTENDKLTVSDKIWEPACGNGKMANVFKENGFEVVSSDIKTDYGITGIDFTTIENPISECYAVITNPPFKYSDQFILQGLRHARLTAMLVKSQYWHALNKTELFKNNRPTYVLPLNWRPDFKEDDRKPGEKKGSPTMEVLWTVWIRGSKVNTIYDILEKPKKPF